MISLQTKSPAYRLLSWAWSEKMESKKHSPKWEMMQDIIDGIEERFPKDFEQFENDNYDGPGDNYYER